MTTEHGITGRFVKGQSGNPGGRPKNGGKRSPIDHKKIQKVLMSMVEVAIEGGKEHLRKMRDDDAKAFNNLILQLYKVNENRLPPGGCPVCAARPEPNVGKVRKVMQWLAGTDAPRWDTVQYQLGIIHGLQDYVEQTTKQRDETLANHEHIDVKQYTGGYRYGYQWATEADKRAAVASVVGTGDPHLPEPVEAKRLPEPQQRALPGTPGWSLDLAAVNAGDD